MSRSALFGCIFSLGVVACSQVLGLDEASNRPGPAAGGAAGSQSAGGSAGVATGGLAGSGGTEAGSAGMSSGGNPNGGAAGSAGTGAAGTGAAGAGASAGDAGSGASAGSGGTTDTCTFEALSAPWVNVPFNGSFETWSGTLPASWSDNDNHPPNGAFEKVAGCHGANAVRLSDLSSSGSIHGLRGFFTPPSVGATSCWTMRGYGRLVSGNLLGAGVTFFAASGAYEQQTLGTTSSWKLGEDQFTLNEPLGTTPFIQLAITANTMDATTVVEFDNLELWYHDGPCN